MNEGTNSTARVRRTRVTGVLLLPLLFVLYLQKHRHKHVRLNVLSLLVVPLGLFAFMLYLRAITGDALAFFHVQAAWERKLVFFLIPLWNYLVEPLNITVGWDLRALNFAAAVYALACGCWLMRHGQWARRLHISFGACPTINDVFKFLDPLQMVSFPVYFVLARAGRNSLIDQTIRAVFIVTLSAMTILFAAHYIIALS